MTMNLKPGQEIAGYPAVKIRHLMRRIRPYDAVTAKFVANALDISESLSMTLISQLINLRFIEKAEGKREPEDEREWYTVTEVGISLALASSAKRITRKTAERVIDEFMRRVEAVNRDLKYYYRIASVLVYGSYLTDSFDLGDVDFAIHLQPRVAAASQEERFRLIRKKIDQARLDGRTFRNLTDEVMWPETEIRLFLKNRKRSISIHSLAEIEELASRKPLKYKILLGDRQAIMAQLGPLAAEV